jgi:phospholipase C
MNRLARPPARLLVSLVAVALALPALSGAAAARSDPAAGPRTATPIAHLVVIFQENVSFDHYFGTYPHAANPPGEPVFTARPDTPGVNGLNAALLTRNPNLANPQRLDRSQAITCGPSNNYSNEQRAADLGLMDHFVQAPGGAPTLAQCLASAGNPAPAGGADPNFAVMDYYDGNTVTALWNYAQHFAMSDSSYGTTFGPSTPGALNVIAGNAAGAVCTDGGHVFAPAGTTLPRCPAAPAPPVPATGQPAGPGTVFGDGDPTYDACSTGGTIALGGRTVGDLLNARGVTWGWFQGGFAPSQRTPAGLPVCASGHANVGGVQEVDYSAHHEPFQYYPQTANPLHLPPSSPNAIGRTDQANHQYDLSDFWTAAGAGRLPAVSYLKAARFEDAHSGSSDPLDEQRFLVDTINRLERLRTWSSTAVVIAYDDSNGWYDHQLGPIVSQSQTPMDQLSGPGACGANAAAVPVGDGGAPQQARCGLGPRLPFLVISPFARPNHVDSGVIDQSSVVRFIEDNWALGRLGGGSADAVAGSIDTMLSFRRAAAEPLFLDPGTGEPVRRDG